MRRTTSRTTTSSTEAARAAAGSPDRRRVATLLAWTWLFFAPGAGAATGVCPAHEVRVSYTETKDFETVCEGARRAIELMSAMGFGTGGALRVEIVDGAEDPRAGASIGWYDAGARALRLLDHATAMERTRENPPFGMPMDAEMYASFVAHETAHAIVHANFAGRRATLIAHEYVAYAVQFATMATALRERILSANGVEGYEREDEVSVNYYLVAPHQFGIKCYLHYARPENGVRFLREVIGDRALRRNF